MKWYYMVMAAVPIFITLVFVYWRRKRIEKQRGKSIFNPEFSILLCFTKRPAFAGSTNNVYYFVLNHFSNVEVMCTSPIKDPMLFP